MSKTTRTVLMILGALMLFCGTCSIGGFVLIRSQVGYDEAVARAVSNARVQKLLGAPVTAGFFFSGAFRTRHDDGLSQIQVTLEGSKQRGTLTASGVMTSGVWGFSRLDVVAEDGKRISLVGD